MAPTALGGNPAICDFLPELRLPDDFVTRGVDVLGAHYVELVRFIREDRPAGQNFRPGPSLSPVAFVEEILAIFGVPARPNALTTHPPAQGTPGGVAVNTLNVEVDGTTVRLLGICPMLPTQRRWWSRR